MVLFLFLNYQLYSKIVNLIPEFSPQLDLWLLWPVGQGKNASVATEIGVRAGCMLEVPLVSQALRYEE